MVAISLYRGNLHKVPDVVRQWPMPAPGITVRDLRLLLRKRSKALARLASSTAPATTTATDLNPNPDAAEKPHEEKEEGMGDNDCMKSCSQSAASEAVRKDGNDEIQCDGGTGGVCLKSEKGEDKEATGPRASVPFLNSSASGDDQHPENSGEVGSFDVKMEGSSLNIVGDKEKRKKELENKLNILNERKHHLVQMLKQILNAEEEMKKQLSLQSSGVRGFVPLQVEATVDAGSATKNVPHKFCSGTNLGGEGGDRRGESDDTQVCQLHHIQSTSPSSAATVSRPTHGLFPHNPGLHTPRPSLVHIGNSQTTSTMPIGSTMASPSRFVHTGHQGHATNLPTVSISGTHFVASSPSPAASGGTSSVFKDSRLTSPL